MREEVTCCPEGGNVPTVEKEIRHRKRVPKSELIAMIKAAKTCQEVSDACGMTPFSVYKAILRFRAGHIMVKKLPLK